MTRNELISQLITTYVAKNRDYGNSVHQTFLEFGEVSTVTRIADKLSRLISLDKSQSRCVADESHLDTMGDAITYLCMLCAELDCTQDSMMDSYPRTLSILSSLGEHNSYDSLPDDIASCRRDLVGIYRGDTNIRRRREGYYVLARLLVCEYLSRTGEDENETR